MLSDTDAVTKVIFKAAMYCTHLPQARGRETAVALFRERDVVNRSESYERLKIIWKRIQRVVSACKRGFTKY